MKKIQNRKKYIKLFNKKNLSILLIFFFAVAKIYLAIQNSSVGAVLSNLEKQTDLLIKENREKQSNLINLSSMISLENKAQEFGYLREPQKLYIKIDDSSASIL